MYYRGTRFEGVWGERKRARLARIAARMREENRQRPGGGTIAFWIRERLRKQSTEDGLLQSPQPFPG